MRKPGVQWGLTGLEVCPQTGKTLSVDLQMLPYNRRDKEDIAPSIVDQMKESGTISTDCWGAYPMAAQQAKCIHLTVNHSENYKDPIIGCHINNVEG